MFEVILNYFMADSSTSHSRPGRRKSSKDCREKETSEESKENKAKGTCFHRHFNTVCCFWIWSEFTSAFGYDSISNCSCFQVDKVSGIWSYVTWHVEVFDYEPQPCSTCLGEILVMKQSMVFQSVDSVLTFCVKRLVTFIWTVEFVSH